MRENCRKLFFNADDRGFSSRITADYPRKSASKIIRVNPRLRYFFIGLIKFYQFSSLIPSACRFYPTCSSYALESIERLGILKGLIKAFLRIGRCHPFSKGGYDPVG